MERALSNSPDREKAPGRLKRCNGLLGLAGFMTANMLNLRALFGLKRFAPEAFLGETEATQSEKTGKRPLEGTGAIETAGERLAESVPSVGGGMKLASEPLDPKEVPSAA